MSKRKVKPIKNIIEGAVFGTGMTFMLMYTDDLTFNEAFKEGGLMGLVFGPLMFVVDLGWVLIDNRKRKNDATEKTKS